MYWSKQQQKQRQRKKRDKNPLLDFQGLKINAQHTCVTDVIYCLEANVRHLKGKIMWLVAIDVIVTPVDCY